MKYKLINNSLNDKYNIIKTVLLNRGVPNWQKYLSLDETCCNDYNDLDNIHKAVELFVSHFAKDNLISILVDCDPDGYTSASMIYNYIKELDPNHPVQYIIHQSNKAHGLAGMDNGDFKLPKDTKLFIIPDAGSNDVEQLNKLTSQGIDCIVLDHHEIESTEEKCTDAIIVNNQSSNNYSNKDFSGAGVVYEFLRALDEYYWTNRADNYLDLVSLAQISDIMDLRSAPTRYYVDKGLENITNPMFQAMIKAQDYSLKGEISPYNIAWYITPILNSIIRIGSYEERELLFRAFIGDYEEFDYKKRDGTIIKENIYNRAARLSKNAKSRQDKLRDKLFNSLLKKANLDDKVVIVETEEDLNGLGGVSAMKLSESISRPVVVLKKLDNGRLGGSCRNYDDSPIENLKELLNSTLFKCQGHANAAGAFIDAKDLPKARELLNKKLKDVVYDSSYLVDFLMDIDDIDIGFVSDINSFHSIWCTGIKEPLVAVTNITVARKDIEVQGKENNSIAFQYNDIKFVQFKMKPEDPLLAFMNEWGDPEDEISFDVVGTCSINNYEGKLYPQFIIKDVEVIE